MKTKKEIPLLAVVLLPFIYISLIWHTLPESVPIHWNIHGAPDGYGSKMTLLVLSGLLPVFTYVIFSILPVIDPKRQINSMGSKYYALKFIVTLLMSALAILIIYMSGNKNTGEQSLIFLLLGVFYTVLGNYFKTIKPNYFIGIRTPWTLENENVWKKTHVLAGKWWFAGGLVVIISTLVLNEQMISIAFIAITVIIAVVPAVYSYILYRRENKVIDTI